MSYVSNTPNDVREMLSSIGVSSINALFSDIPKEILLDRDLDLASPMSEIEVNSHLRALSDTNKILHSFVGAGQYNHYIPAAVDQLTLRSEFYTAYTPYQPEVSQGTLTAIFEFQTMICRLSGMDVANASMYDGATSLAEAVFLSIRSSGKKTVLVPSTLHPHYRRVLETYLWANDIVIREVSSINGVIDTAHLKKIITSDISAVIVQDPTFFGALEDTQTISAIAHENGALCIQVVMEALSLALLETPASLGVDILCGEGQSFGNAVGFGGPCLGLLAAKEPFIRRMPGRLVGKTIDADGKTAFCLTLQTREQHIRRDRATSNICSNEGLCALRAVIYLSLFGNSLRDLAALNHSRASYIKKEFDSIGIKPAFNTPFFNESVYVIPNTHSVLQEMNTQGYDIGVDCSKWFPEMKNHVLVSATECNSIDQIDSMVKALSQTLKKF